MNNPFRKAIGAIGVGVIIVGGAYIRQQNGGTTTPPPPPSGLANIFVDTNGGTCTWTGVPLSYVTGGDAKSCSSMDLANKAATTASASSGTVLIENGSYAQQVLLASGRTVTDGTCTIQPTGSHYTEQSNYTGCVTFSPDTNQTPTFDGIAVLTAGVRFVGLTDTNPGTLTTVGTTENIGLQVAWKNTLTGVSCKTVPQPHDVVFDQMHVFVTGGTPIAGAAPLSGAYASGVYNVSVVNSDFGPVYDNPATWQFSDLVQGSSANCASFSPAQLQDRAIYLGHNNLHDFIQDVPANGSGCSTDAAQYNCNHAEGIHWRASNSWVIGNRFTNIEQQGISVQTDANDPNIANTAFVGNIFDAPCSNQPSPPCTFIGAATFINNTNGNALTNDIIAFNSLNGAFIVNNDGGTPVPFPGTVWSGNITTGYGGNGTSGGCPVSGTMLLNAIPSAASLCGTDFHTAGNASPYVNAATQDFTLSGTPSIANLVPASQTAGSVTVLCPALDISLLTRPVAGNTNCAPGAYEPPVTSVTGASLGICSGSCTQGTIPALSGSVPTTNCHDSGNISDGVNLDHRYYCWYIPAGLVTNDPTHQPAAVFYLAGGGGDTTQSVLQDTGNFDLKRSGMMAQANTNKFVIIYLLPPLTSGGHHTGWLHPLTDCGGSGGVIGAGTCGASNSPSDTPYIVDAINDATSRFNLDPNRRYAVGGSSGANAARELICDSRSVGLIRAVMTMGGGANAKYKTATGSCPQGNQQSFYLEISGTATQQDPYNTIDLVSGDHTILGFDSTRAWWSGTYLGNCSAASHLTTGSGVISNVYDYSCANQPFSVQFEAVSVTNGGHTWCNLDSTPQTPSCTTGASPSASSNNTGGWSSASWVWNWFATRRWAP